MHPNANYKSNCLNSTDFNEEKLKILLLQCSYLPDGQNTTHIADSYSIIRQQCTGSSTGRPQKMTSVQKGTDRQKHTSKSIHTPLESGNNGASKQASYSFSQSFILDPQKSTSLKCTFFSETEMRKSYVIFHRRELLFKTFCNSVNEYSATARAASASHCLSHKKDMSYKAVRLCPSLIRMVLFINIALQKNFLFEMRPFTMSLIMRLCNFVFLVSGTRTSHS